MSTNVYDLWRQVNDAEIAAHATDVDCPTWRDRVQWTRAHDITTREVYRGSTTLDGRDISQPLGFKVVERWCDQPYRMVWISLEHHVILTFCEGDLSYETHPDSSSFQRAFYVTNAFYLGLKS